MIVKTHQLQTAQEDHAFGLLARVSGGFGRRE